VQERLAGIGVVRAYTMEARATAEFAAANAALRDASALLARTQAHFTPLMGLVTGLGTLVVLWAGGAAVASGRITLGALVAFTGYLGYLAWPTASLGFTLAIFRRGLTSMERVQQVLNDAVWRRRTAPRPPGGPARRRSALPASRSPTRAVRRCCAT
jgi:ATP-binding cassette subfamily B protein